ncbi:MAG: T9SS type A sorting domain-containing protein [Bacteroidota bacterium]
MKKKIILYIIFLSLATSFVSFSNTFVVTTTSDSGSGSLRDAITNANGIPGNHTISFNIPTTDAGYNATTGVWTITPLTTYLPITRNNLTIDGTTQTSNVGNTNPLGPEIMLNGNQNSIDYCFWVTNAANVTIKGFIICDFIYGIQIYGSSSLNNVITGNYIGLKQNGTDTLGNYIGIEIFGGASQTLIGGSTPADRNIVSGNEHIGIRLLNSGNNTLIGNYVGTDRTGMIAKGNYDGISIEGTSNHNIVGGTNAGEGNLVSGNVAYGIPIFGAGADSTLVIGNLIGTNINGNAAVPNTYGVLFDDGARGNIVGGISEQERNIISGNSAYGVFIYNLGTTQNKVLYNYIGTDISGTLALPNANGIVIDGAADTHYIMGNVISGNLQQGIDIHITGSNHHIIAGNLIGTDKTALLPLANGSDGIRIGEGGKYNIIGGDYGANVIAYNQGNGVSVITSGDINNRISKNTIYQNSGLGIDLFPQGITPNDSGDIDTGPNQLMNYPIINPVQALSGGQFKVSGTLDTQLPQFCTIELFLADINNAGYPQGKVFLSSCTPDIYGNWSDTLNNLIWQNKLTATATDSAGNTSEFSVAIPAGIGETVQSFNNIVLYPNPATNNISLSGNHILEVTIYNELGEEIKSLQKVPSEIDVSGFSLGLYLMKINTSEGMVIKKFIKQ